jgi:hypothetical protein
MLCHLVAHVVLCCLAAAGTEDGYIIIWDFETLGVAKLINGHR